jgi:hypothetical protein
MPNGIEFEGRYAQVGTYPIGIEPMQFVDGLRMDKVQDRLAAMKRRFEGCKVIIGVDRLDYIKGIPQKLHALEVFLAQHPEWVGKVSLGCLVSTRNADVYIPLLALSCPISVVTIIMAFCIHHSLTSPLNTTGRPCSTSHPLSTRCRRVPKPPSLC